MKKLNDHKHKDKSIIDPLDMDIPLSKLEAEAIPQDIMESIMCGHLNQSCLDCIWENRILGEKFKDTKILPLKEVQDLVHQVLETFGFSNAKPNISIRKDVEGSNACTGYNDLTKEMDMAFNKSTSFRHIILHECAHAIMNLGGLRENDEHGPTFIRIECEVYSRFMGVDLAWLIKSAQDTKLGVDDTLPDFIKLSPTELKKAA